MLTISGCTGSPIILLLNNASGETWQVEVTAAGSGFLRRGVKRFLAYDIRPVVRKEDSPKCFS